MDSAPLEPFEGIKGREEFSRAALDVNHLDRDLAQLLFRAHTLMKYAHGGTKRRNGLPTPIHPQYVSNEQYDDVFGMIVGLLHDVVEDTRGKWNQITLEDLEFYGFPSVIVDAVDGITRRPNEKYYDYIVRLGTFGPLAIRSKLVDLRHNSDSDIEVWEKLDDKQRRKHEAYKYAEAYLQAIDREEIRPGTSMATFICENYSGELRRDGVKLLETYSSEGAPDCVLAIA